MADVDFITYSMVDDKGRTASLQVFFETGFTVAQVQAFSDVVAPLLDDMTGLQILTAQVNLSLTIPGTVKATPTVGVDAEKGANMGYDAADTDYRHTMRVPGILDANITGELVNDAVQEVIDWNTGITSGDGTVTPTDRYANDLVSFIQGRVTFRK